MKFIEKYLQETISVIKNIEIKQINKVINIIIKTKKKNGRIFFLGVGGSAANASHAVNDFRKICGIECYCATDNISEITAITNDEGWENAFVDWLKNNKLIEKDLIFILSVGGGSYKKKISMNIVNAIKFAKSKKVKIISIIGKKDGYAYFHSNAKILIPNVNNNRITPYSEQTQAILWHLLVSHPKIKKNLTMWEMIDKKK
jgi:D-sedoheptulose 7-phosphate isomerase